VGQWHILPYEVCPYPCLCPRLLREWRCPINHELSKWFAQLPDTEKEKHQHLDYSEVQTGIVLVSISKVTYWISEKCAGPMKAIAQSRSTKNIENRFDMVHYPSLPVDIRINRITSSSWLSNYRLCFMCSGSVGESESNALRCIMPMKVVNLVDIQTRMGMTAITNRSRSQQIESSFTKLWKFDCH
jgi:hypothetical protein